MTKETEWFGESPEDIFEQFKSHLQSSTILDRPLESKCGSCIKYKEGKHCFACDYQEGSID